ncbi:hypothetical protein [Methylobacterium oryzisoli]|uniref:hypothetical protein n=1 Tax=Methylobacterium oryzisoli TaxID=3385502 RepID=UPI003891300C
MKINRNALDRLASEVRAEINNRVDSVKIISIDFDNITNSALYPGYTARTEGGSAKDRLMIAKYIIQVMGRHMRQLESRYIAAT